jgi:hypothetical protein
MNVFEEIESDETLPLSVKEEMVSSLDTFKLFGDLVDMFFVKAGQVAVRAIGPETSSSTQAEPGPADE